MKRLLTLVALMCALVASAVNPSGTLPVLHINTSGSQPVTSKEYYLDATCWLDPCDTDAAPLGSADAPVALQIKGRGNYTWKSFDKKPYRLKFSEKVKIMGMNANKHFALLAHADDCRGFLRNAVGFELSRMIGMPWTPADRPVEVVLNGEYRGLYFLTETIRVGSKRVNIEEQKDLATDPKEVTGGWLVEIDNYSDDPHVSVQEGNGGWINFTYHSPEELSEQQKTFLLNQMRTINALLYQQGQNVPDGAPHWGDYVDLEQLARFYIVQELTDNYESFTGSCYLYRDRGEDCKWEFGPVWDFGSAFNYTKTQYCYQGREHPMHWIEQMCLWPEFMDVVKELWVKFVDEHYYDVIDFASNYRYGIAAAAAADYQRWPQYGNRDLDDATRTVVSRLKSAFNWLCNKWGGSIPDIDWNTPGACTVFFRDNDPNPWDNVHIFLWNSHGSVVGTWPGSPMKLARLGDEELWSYCFIPEFDVKSTHTGLIFNNSKSGEGNQTADLELVPGGIYERHGLVAGVGERPAEGLSVRALPGAIEVTAAEACRLVLTRLDGSCISLDVPAGTTLHRLPRGFYIVNKRKILI